MSDKTNILKSIVDHLILYSLELNDIGLFYGKMGILIFFEHYAKYTSQSVYEDFAGYMFDEICDDIQENMPIGLSNGLCGIGWGIEYLIQNDFVKGDSGEILLELDRKVLEYNLTKMQDVTLEKGVIGLLNYIYMRVNNKRGKNCYFCDLKDCLDSSLYANRILNWNNIFTTNIVDFISLNKEFSFENLGLNNGCCGFALKLILEKHAN